ncbi:hypothetical protein ACFV3R_30895 [Streptomyces sp. NPDC059740]|uniref:hypothetical protein n=1 Tax=Streptomyces sp. NPDC059740 TaxID=3346926 RepID=UPI00365C0641
MGYKFSLVLNREVTEQETVKLKEIACGNAAFDSDTLPTDASVAVTRIDFDDTVSPTLAEAIEAGMQAVKQLPELEIPGLSVPAQPAGPVTETDEAVTAEATGPEGTAAEKAESKAAS